MAGDVTENTQLHRFELAIAGNDLAIAAYRIDDRGRVVLTHTEVPKEYSGQGVGGRLARGVFDAIRASGRKLVPQCPFMAAWYERHPDYADVVDA